MLYQSLADMSLTEGASSWIERVKSAEKTCIIHNGVRKVHYKFKDDVEMAEEYNLQTDVLMRRAWKKNGSLSKEGEWDVELGDPEPTTINTINTFGIREASNMPYVIKRITKANIEWRVKNMPYPLETYSVTALPDENCIVVRTVNKKYFKKLQIPELERVGLTPKQENISFSHNLNILIILYKKPPEVIKAEQTVLSMVKSLKTIKDPDQLPCNPS